MEHESYSNCSRLSNNTGRKVLKFIRELVVYTDFSLGYWYDYEKVVSLPVCRVRRCTLQSIRNVERVQISE